MDSSISTPVIPTYKKWSIITIFLFAILSFFIPLFGWITGSINKPRTTRHGQAITLIVFAWLGYLTYTTFSCNYFYFNIYKNKVFTKQLMSDFINSDFDKQKIIYKKYNHLFPEKFKILANRYIYLAEQKKYYSDESKYYEERENHAYEQSEYYHNRFMSARTEAAEQRAERNIQRYDQQYNEYKQKRKKYYEQSKEYKNELDKIMVDLQLIYSDY